MAATQVSLEVRIARSMAVLAQMRLRKNGAASGFVLQLSSPLETIPGIKMTECFFF